MRPSDRFIKLMMMTTSTNDAEALVALRMANAMMAGANMNWSEFLLAMAKQSEPQLRHEAKPYARSQPKPKVKPEPKPKVKPEPKPKEKREQRYSESEINTLFARAYRSLLSGKDSEFIKDIRIFWCRSGFLTDTQYAWLKRAAARK